MKKLLSLSVILLVALFCNLTNAQTIRYVKVTGTGTQDGSSWANAAPGTSLQTIISNSAFGDQVWVAKGKYLPTFEYDGTGDAYKTFRLKEGVKVYGGFAGTETKISQRANFGFGQTNATTLSGDHLGNDDWDNGFTIMLSSMSDNSRCVVNTNYISPSLTNNCVLDGFVISGGRSTGIGGGLFISAAPYAQNPIISNCTIRNNYASSYGAGIYMASTTGGINNCVIENNYSSHQGGGFYGYTPFFYDNIVRNNTASYGGGVFATAGASLKIQNCIIENNTASSQGGGIYTGNSSNLVYIIGNTISANTSTQGAGIYAQMLLQIKNNTIYDNVATDKGAGILTYNSNCEITNNTIYNNLCNGDGGGILIFNYAPFLTNNTITNNYSDNDNNAVGSGGGVFIFSGANGYFKNNLIANNYIGSGTTTPNDFTASTTAMVDNGYNLVEHSTGYTWIGTGSITGEQASLNIDAALSGDQPQNIALHTGSVAIDAGGTGTNSTVNVPLFDQRGLARNGNTDIGAYEFNGIPNMSPTNNVLFVTPNGAGTKDGSSWSNAFDGAKFFNNVSKLAFAIANLSSGNQIWVAKGTYIPTDGTDRTISFVLKDGVSLYGGFAGNENSLEQRNIDENPTILSGDIGTPLNILDNSYTIVYCNTTSSNSTIIDGFTIEKGRSNGTLTSERQGGGMWLGNNSAFTIKNCTIHTNYADLLGGGVVANAACEFINCYIYSNYSNSNGGGIVVSKSNVRNCTFAANIANGGLGGAIMSNAATNIVFENNTFINNVAENRGGALYLAYSTNSAYQIVTNNTFFDNLSGSNGGAIYITDVAAVITNNTIVRNACSKNVEFGTNIGGGVSVSTTTTRIPLFKNNHYYPTKK
ncbi:MAG: right-handed parallel beta-helix repeat-containing protein [Bacteroidetes bacterium]|nr:right-handed parallel beta-helix repeat-containing protein [Bacteroidota bacterium]